MDIARITDDVVRHALECVRRAGPLRGNPLLEMAALQRRLADEGFAASPEGLEWALGVWLHDLIAANLAGLRRAAGLEPVATGLDRLQVDYQQDNADLEAWSYLYYRYAAGLGLQQQDLATRARPGYEYANRHLQRRAALGFRLLARVLRDAEQLAVRSFQASVPVETSSLALPDNVLGFLAADLAAPESGGVLADRFQAALVAAVTAGGGRLAIPRARPGAPVLAYFKAPAGVLAAAVALNRAMAADVPDPAGGLVCIALHTGVVDWLGTAANLCLRLCAAGHGGQVLLTAPAVSRAGQHIPVGWALEDLGGHRLAETAPAERVFLLRPARSSATYPPLRAPVAQP